MSGPTQSWEDRRALFQRGKEVHEPARRPSQSSVTGAIVDTVRRASVGSVSGSTIEKTLTGSSAGSASSPTGQRRRSSQSGVLFGNLQQHKRGGDNYDTRRAGHADQSAAGGLVSGWFNSTFRGMKSENSEK